MKRTLLLFLLLIAYGSHAQNPYIIATPLISGLSNPLAMAHCNDSRIFIVQKNGIIRIADALTGALNPVPFMDIDARVGSSGSEQGLLGMAFHPDYKTNGYFFVNYTNNSGHTVISRFSVNPADSNLALPASEIPLHTINQPFSNHNGGHLAFGPDGYLYIGMGDGGSSGDPQNHAQNPNSLLGKMLRIDVSHGDSSLVPATNPFINTSGYRAQIWHTGLRNPWRYSFDKLTGDLWIGDVGQNAMEEIDFQPASSTGGENWGWRCYEGNSNFNTTGCQPQNTYNAPIYQYSHAGGNCSVSGGYVYRGAMYGNFNGYYLFADYCVDMLRTLHKTDVDTTHLSHTALPGSSVGFGEDMYGELYAFNMSGGSVLRIEDTTGCAPAVQISTLDTIQLCDTVGVIRTAYHPSLIYSWYKDNVQLSFTEAEIPVNAEGSYVVIALNPNNACFNSDTVYVKLGNPAVQISWTGDIQSDTAICANIVPISLLAATPVGGIFYGASISNDTLYAQNFLQNNGPADNLIEYRYTDTLGCVYNSVLKVHYGICFGINENDQNTFSLFPNPATTSLNVIFAKPAGEKTQWQLMDASGRIIRSGNLAIGTTQFTADVSDLEAGSYLFLAGEQQLMKARPLLIVR